MDIDLKAEKKKIEDSMQQLVDEANKINDSINLLQQQKQVIINSIIGEKRLLEYLQQKEPKK